MPTRSCLARANAHLIGLVPGNLNAAHVALELAGIVEGQMLGATVVPKGDRAGGPAEAAGEFLPMAMIQQEFQQRAAFLLAHVLKADRVAVVDEQQLAAGLRMGAHHRMQGDG